MKPILISFIVAFEYWPHCGFPGPGLCVSWDPIEGTSKDIVVRDLTVAHGSGAEAPGLSPCGI